MAVVVVVVMVTFVVVIVVLSLWFLRLLPLRLCRVGTPDGQWRHTRVSQAR